jgi:hypothetical protein
MQQKHSIESLILVYLPNLVDGNPNLIWFASNYSMKKKLLLLSFLAITTMAWAQITITGSDLPSVSGVYIRDNASNSNIIKW